MPPPKASTTAAVLPVAVPTIISAFSNFRSKFSSQPVIAPWDGLLASGATMSNSWAPVVPAALSSLMPKMAAPVDFMSGMLGMSANRASPVLILGGTKAGAAVTLEAGPKLSASSNRPAAVPPVRKPEAGGGGGRSASSETLSDSALSASTVSTATISPSTGLASLYKST